MCGINHVMSYYVHSLETELIVDASPSGLDAMLYQFPKSESKVVSYASCTLDDVQSRYSQT